MKKSGTFRMILGTGLFSSHVSSARDEGREDDQIEKKRSPGCSWLLKGPGLVLFLAILAIAVPGLVEGGWPESNMSSGSLGREALSREAIISLTNDARATEGLVALDENPLLDAIAEARARDMLEKQYFAHISPTGDRAALIAQKVGYRYRVIAENIASGFFSGNRKVVDAWMQSPGHRRNILSSRVRELGVSVVHGTMNGTRVAVCVQLFGLQWGYGSERAPLSAALEMRVAAIEGLGARLRNEKRELDVEKSLLESGARDLAGDPGRSEELNARISAYNEKVDRHNRALAELGAMKKALDRMAGERERQDMAAVGYRTNETRDETRPTRTSLASIYP